MSSHQPPSFQAELLNMVFFMASKIHHAAEPHEYWTCKAY